jgi:signal transduction histidine kinase
MPERRRQVAVAAVLAVVCVLLVAVRPGFANSPAPVLPVALLAFATGAWLSTRRGLIGVLALMVSMQVAMGFADFPNVEIAIFALLPWLGGVELRNRRRLVAQLLARRTELEEAEDAFVRLAVRRERAAIALELHDIVAHHLAVIVVQAGAGRVAGTGAASAAVDVERFRTIRASGEQALTEMALLVDVLESDRAEEGFARLPALIAQAAAGGLDVRLTPVPAGVAVAPEVAALAVTVIHESLTNAIKHAPGATVDLDITARADVVEVDVVDTGASGEATLSATGAGLGLAGLRERVSALGGTLDAGPHADGWRVHACLPRVPDPSTG